MCGTGFRKRKPFIFKFSKLILSSEQFRHEEDEDGVITFYYYNFRCLNASFVSSR